MKMTRNSPHSWNQRRPLRPSRSWGWSTSLVVMLFASVGCSDIETEYGQRANTSSVNGTSVLADMFEEAGHKVASWPWLSPRLQNEADVIVWFPNNFEPPSPEVRSWLEAWMMAKTGRTLVYVGRDYDAAPDYWEYLRQGTTGSQNTEISRKLADARNEFFNQRHQLPQDGDAEWFKIDSQATPRSVRTLSGKPEWTADVDPTKLQIELNSRFQPGAGDEILLESNGDALITRAEWGDSQLLVVTNGSLFLNLKVINHEHRKLAGHLIDAVGPPVKNVYFLDSKSAEARIYQEDPKRPSGNPLQRILRPPLDSIALQLALLGLLFAWSRLPIFGIPRKIEPPRLADFGQHVAALGELLAATGDEQYARSRLAAYHQLVRHDTPRSRLEPPKPAPAIQPETAAEAPEPPANPPPMTNSPT